MSNSRTVKVRVEEKFKWISQTLIPVISDNYRIGTKKKPMNKIMVVNWGVEYKRKRFEDVESFYSGRCDKVAENDLIACKEQIRLYQDLKDPKFLEKKNNVFFYNFVVRPMKSSFYDKIKKIWPDGNQVEEVKKIWSEKDGKTRKNASLKTFMLDLEKSIDFFKSVVDIAKPNTIVICGRSLKEIIEFGLQTNLENYYKDIAFTVAPYSYFEIGFEKNEKDAILYVPCGRSDEYEMRKNEVLEYLKEKYFDYCYSFSSILQDEFSMTGLSGFKIYNSYLKRVIEAIPLKPLALYHSLLTKNVEFIINKYCPKPPKPEDQNRTKKARNEKAKKKSL